MAGKRDARVDAYIGKARPFAQPILNHIRETIHRACPEVDEAIKWGMPFFELNGIILGNMAAFKEHCSLGLWGPEMAAILGSEGEKSSEAMGTFGRIGSVKDLPGDKALLGYVRQAAGFVLRGERKSSLVRPAAKKKARVELVVSAELTAALKKNKAAAKVFAEFSPSCKKEYAEWISEAKREETKAKRVVQAVEWIAEGKQRHWKYQNC